jgi:glutamate 5-kinase
MSDLWRDSRRIVIKLGTQVVLEADGQLARKRLTQLINHCAVAWQLDKEILLVSSGAVGLGDKSLKISQSKKKSLNLVEKQACASVGQNLLMDIYRELFSAHGITTAQILVTASDFSDRRRYLILRQTLEKLLSMRVIPIINENDAISTMELKEGTYSSSFGDNDKLSALVAGKLDADLLVILTNVEGIFSADPERNPEATLISEIDSFEQLASIDSNGTSPQGRGGMSAKIEALRIAFISGVHTMIRSGNNPDTLLWMTNAEVSPEGGTLVKPGVSLPKRRSWIGLASSTFGRVVVNSGAVDALVERNASLLPSGVVGVEGSFQAGQVISIEDEQGHNVGRGISRFPSRDVLKILGLKSAQISNVLGKDARTEVIHRDNLVVFKEHFGGTASGDFKK